MALASSSSRRYSRTCRQCDNTRWPTREHVRRETGRGWGLPGHHFSRPGNTVGQTLRPKHANHCLRRSLLPRGGHEPSEILADFPELTEADIIACLAMRGRDPGDWQTHAVETQNNHIHARPCRPPTMMRPTPPKLAGLPFPPKRIGAASRGGSTNSIPTTSFTARTCRRRSNSLSRTPSLVKKTSCSCRSDVFSSTFTPISATCCRLRAVETATAQTASSFLPELRIGRYPGV